MNSTDSLVMEYVASHYAYTRAAALLLGIDRAAPPHGAECSPSVDRFRELLADAGFREVPLDEITFPEPRTRWPLADKESVTRILFRKPPGSPVSGNEISVAAMELRRQYFQVQHGQSGLRPESTRVLGVTVIFDPPLGEIDVQEVSPNAFILTDNIRVVALTLNDLAVDGVSYGRVSRDATVTIRSTCVEVDGQERDPVPSGPGFL